MFPEINNDYSYPIWKTRFWIGFIVVVKNFSKAINSHNPPSFLDLRDSIFRQNTPLKNELDDASTKFISA